MLNTFSSTPPHPVKKQLRIIFSAGTPRSPCARRGAVGRLYGPVSFLSTARWAALHAPCADDTAGLDGNTGTACFTLLRFGELWTYCVFYELKVCSKSVSSKSIGTIFPISICLL